MSDVTMVDVKTSVTVVEDNYKVTILEGMGADGKDGLDTVSVVAEHLQGLGTPASPLDFSDNVHHQFDFFVGCTLHDVQGDITSDGVTITAEVEALGGGDVDYRASDGVKVLDCTPKSTVELTPGSDSVPQLNYMYIDTPTNLFTANTTGFPATEHVPLAIAFIGSAAFVQTDGTYKTHQWNDHLHSVGDNGHLSHINKWIRSRHATWISGGALSHSGSGSGTVEIAISSGVMFQAHEHNFEAEASPAKIFIPNHETVPYTATTNLANVVTDSEGATINNKYVPFVLWYAYSAIPGDSKVFLNKPSGGYNSEALARADANKFANFSIPAEFKGTAFLVHRLIARNSVGNLTIFDGPGDDLRGTLPNTAAGSSTSISSTFLDSVFRIHNLADTTKQLALDVSGVTTGTTRTLGVPDKDGKIHINNRNDHETITAASPATLNATTATEHTGDFTESWTAILAGFTADNPSLLFEFVVSGGLPPTITLSGATFAFATTQNLTDLDDGTYQAVFNSVDDGTNVTVYVKLMP